MRNPALRFAFRGIGDQTAEISGGDGNFFSDQSAFVRRIAYTALCVKGEGRRDIGPANLAQRIVDGICNPEVWVRYDGARQPARLAEMMRSSRQR
jgi:hypothetical protein